MSNGLVEFSGLEVQLSHHKFRGSISRVDLKLLFQLFARIVHSRGCFRRGKDQTGQAVVDTRESRILLQDLPIFLSRFLPFTLCFKRFSVELSHLVRGQTVQWSG